jgi:hypothetical protein
MSTGYSREREKYLELLRRTEELQERLVATTERRLRDLEEYQQALARLYGPGPRSATHRVLPRKVVGEQGTDGHRAPG